MPIPLSEKNVGQLSPIFYDRTSPGFAMFIAESLKVPLRIFGSGHLIRWHHLSPKHIRDLGELEAKIKKLIWGPKIELKNLLELPIEDFEAVANLFGVFYRVEFGSHGSTELGPSVYIAGVRLKGSRDFSLEAEFSRPFRTKRGGVFLPAALLLLRTLHHALKQRPKLVLCIRSVPTTVNYPSFCEIKAWTIWTTKKKLMRTCFVCNQARCLKIT